MKRSIRLVGGPKNDMTVLMPNNEEPPSVIVYQGFFREFFGDNSFHVCDYVNTAPGTYTFSP